MKISCKYSILELSSSLIGSKFRLLLSKKGMLKSFSSFWFDGIGDFLLLFMNKDNNEVAYRFTPKGVESLGGNLFGFVIEKMAEEKRFDKLGYNYSISGGWEENEIIQILGYGENSQRIISDAFSLEKWYKGTPNTSIPNELIVDKKTIDFIAMELSNEKWIYICAGGEGYYSVYFDRNESPNKFIEEMLYEENGQKIELLETLK